MEKKIINCFTYCAVKKKYVPVKEWNCKEIFNTNFNLSFGKAKSDNRCFCDKMKYIVWSNNIIHDADKKKLINVWGINKRNVVNIQLWISFLNHSQFKTIVQKFLESGHSFLPNDRDFSRIKRAKRKAK